VTDRQTHTQTDRHIHRQTDRHIHRQTDTHGSTDRQTKPQKDYGHAPFLEVYKGSCIGDGVGAQSTLRDRHFARKYMNENFFKCLNFV